MTTDEDLTEIGRMYLEQEEVERKLTCVENKLKRFKEACQQATSILSVAGEDHRWEVKRNEGSVSLAFATFRNNRIDRQSTFPRVEEFADALEDREQLQLRLDELRNFFEQRRNRR